MNDRRLDHARIGRTGIPEVVFAEFKSAAQTQAILREMVAQNGFGLATRVPPEGLAELAAAFPDGRLDARARAFAIGRLPASGRTLAVVCAGTSDLPVADEAAFTLDAFGHTVVRQTDVGVAGLHRLLDGLDALNACDAIVAVAGMEGALPSVLGGLVRPPVIAVPTSVGYGVSTGGTAALHAMLASCAPGIAVVNIDNGFGAACAAHKIALAVNAR